MNLLESLYAPSRGDEMTETEKVEDVQPQHKPAFSLHMIPPKRKKSDFCERIGWPTDKEDSFLFPIHIL